jgi:hypothetical protein
MDRAVIRTAPGGLPIRLPRPRTAPYAGNRTGAVLPSECASAESLRAWAAATAPPDPTEAPL